MPHPAIRLIAVDLDGTLLSHEGRVGPANRAALLAAERAGITVVIATGRRHTYALNVLHDLGLSPDTILISSNGAVVRTFRSALLERTLMDPAAARWLCAHLGEFRNALVITFDKTLSTGEDARGSLVVEELADLHNSISRWMIANEPYLLRVEPIEDSLHGEAPIQMMLCGTVARMRAAEALMLQHPGVAPVGDPRATGTISLNRTEYPERDLSIVDILPAGCSKGAAILRLAASRGIIEGEIMAIGDNWNDLSMLEIAALPVLMGNAPADLLAMAEERQWLISAAHHADGVAEAIATVLPEIASEPAPGTIERESQAGPELVGLKR